MQDFLTWGAVIGAAGSIITVIKFWMDMGAVAVKAEQAMQITAVTAARSSLIGDQLNAFKVEAAQTYATAKALETTEASLIRSLNTSIQGIYSRLDNMTNRLDSLITIAKRGEL